MRELSVKKYDDENYIKNANDEIIDYLTKAMHESKGEFVHLRRKLSITYWIIIILSVIMFALGLVLLSVPIAAAFGGNIEQLNSLISAGFGIADLTALFLFKPIERIQKIMGDMSQLILVLNSYRSQVSLKLMEMDIKERSTIGITADKINKIAVDSVKLIQNYFEEKETAK
jgi:hypothetical protein